MNADQLHAVLNLPDGATGTATVASSSWLMRGVRGGLVEARSAFLHAGDVGQPIGR